MSGYTCSVLRLFVSVPREILGCDTALYMDALAMR
jgi:hypothetical protein